MRRGLLVLLASLMLNSAVAAQSPVSLVRSDQIARSSTKPEAEVARLSPDDVVSRMLTFDSDRDGKVARSELAERMQPLVVRADKNRDGALDPKEIRAVAARSPSPQQEREHPVEGSYGFADEEASFSWLNHVDGAIEDLRLAADAKDGALSIAMTYAQTIEADAGANLARDLFGVLSPAQISALQESLKTRPRAVSVPQSQDGINRRFVVSGGALVPPNINQFRLTPDKRLLVQRAVDRYTARLKMMSEPERVALVDRMTGVLDVEERDNLRAALARRPLVDKEAVAGVVGAQANPKNIPINTFKGTIRGTGTIRTTDPAFADPTSLRVPQQRR